jgi:hypothetical protein
MARANKKVHYNFKLGQEHFDTQLGIVRKFSGDVLIAYSQTPFQAPYREIKPFVNGAEEPKDHSKLERFVTFSTVCRLGYSFPDAGKGPLTERIADFGNVLPFYVPEPGENPEFRAGDIAQDITHQIGLRLQKIYEEINKYGRKILISLKKGKQDVVTQDILDLMVVEGLPQRIAFLSDGPQKPYVPHKKRNRIFVP